ncbi:MULTISPECIES: hypothetical protein [Sporosarcina]|uniref:hypothetical protein n=1 Tax=Sporosarcina TaxID=1569 RepID=UPI000694FF12|nr:MULTISPECIES: hypothetical protein [Sporosarcina]WJY27527.1 hypothetical protein QWT68_00450 [Sporosarcina sp. 0.2-SM1T-5]
MALVNQIKKKVRNAKLHSSVEATYNVFKSGGRKYIQINTYGSNDRKVQGSVSQTIQMSEEVIKQLKEILDNQY